MVTEIEQNRADMELDTNEVIEPLISLASALLDPQRLKIAAALANGPANRMELTKVTGLTHREALRQLDILREFGVVVNEDGAGRREDHYTRFSLNEEAFRSARQAMGKYKGRKRRPSDARELTLETFMPGGKLVTFPLKQQQVLFVLDKIAGNFELEKQYKEAEVNVILEEINEDYCTLRRQLIEYGYMSRSNGIYTKNA